MFHWMYTQLLRFHIGSKGGGGGELKTVVTKWKLELPFARLAEDEDCKKVDDRFSFSS